MRRLALDLVLLADLFEHLVRLVRGEIGGEFDLEGLLEAGHQRYLPEGRCEVDLDLGQRVALLVLRVMLDLERAADVAHHLAQQCLGERHQVVVVGVGPVELARRELGIMSRVHPFVAEEAPDLVDAVEPAYHEHLEEQLGRDAHVQVAVQVVVVRDERLRRRAAGDHVHQGSLDLEEAVHVEEAAHEGDDLGARAEDVAHRPVHDQVEVALPVARLGRQRILRLGDHVQARREDDERGGEDGELAALGLAGLAGHTHHIAALRLVHQLHEARQPRITRELCKVGVRAEELDFEAVAMDVVEDEAFAARALAHDASRDALRRRRERARLDRLGVRRVVLRQTHRRDELVRVWVGATALDAVDPAEPVVKILARVDILLLLLERGALLLLGLRRPGLSRRLLLRLLGSRRRRLLHILHPRLLLILGERLEFLHAEPDERSQLFIRPCSLTTICWLRHTSIGARSSMTPRRRGICRQV